VEGRRGGVKREFVVVMGVVGVVGSRGGVGGAGMVMTETGNMSISENRRFRLSIVETIIIFSEYMASITNTNTTSISMLIPPIMHDLRL
jgi:energy-converting hydrogenase Eha subunit H